MTVSRFGSGFGRAIFFSGFLSCFTGILCPGSSSAASFVAILRDVRGGARRLPGASFPVEVSEPSLAVAFSVILQGIHTRYESGDSNRGFQVFLRVVETFQSQVVRICEYDWERIGW